MLCAAILCLNDWLALLLYTVILSLCHLLKYNDDDNDDVVVDDDDDDECCSQQLHCPPFCLWTRQDLITFEFLKVEVRVGVMIRVGAPAPRR